MKRFREEQVPERATADRFREIFSADMGSLYLLAYLLTGDDTKAEACFLSALDDCLDSGFVFPERAHSWARRAIIKSAIQRGRPSPNANLSPAETVSKIKEPELASKGLDVVMRMKTFRRFVFVMSALERYPDRECAILLDCTIRDVVGARNEALRGFSGTSDVSWHALPAILQIA
jgi:hypothetical protein